MRVPKWTVHFVTLCLMAGCAILKPEKTWKDFDFKVYHLGTAGQPEWLEFAQDPPHGRDLAVPFQSEIVNEGEATLLLWQSNVKYGWSVSVNGRKLGQLPLYEVPMISAFSLPAGTLKKGDNTLGVASLKETEDILVGM